MWQIFAAVGTTDPRFNTVVGLYFRIGQKLKAYARQDLPPARVHPIPITILHCLSKNAQGGSSRQQAIADLVWITFFFPLKPGEYC